jgi:hypothetical protein
MQLLKLLSFNLWIAPMEIFGNFVFVWVALQPSSAVTDECRVTPHMLVL